MDVFKAFLMSVLTWISTLAGNDFYFGHNNTPAVSPLRIHWQANKRTISGALPPLVELITRFQLQEIAPRQRRSQVMCMCDSEVYSQLGWSSRSRSLCAFSYLLLLLPLLLASVVRTLPHGQPPLEVRGRFGVAVLGQFAFKEDQEESMKGSTQLSIAWVNKWDGSVVNNYIIYHHKSINKKDSTGATHYNITQGAIAKEEIINIVVIP